MHTSVVKILFFICKMIYFCSAQKADESSSKLSVLSFYNNIDKAQEVAEYVYKNTGVEFSNSSYNGNKGGVFSVVSILHLTASTLVDPKVL
ncbi:hypothetical protein M9991_01220 [Chryseobacterium gallinarum]|uniref:hypothetical protein n=1 Tax=Chryseobacterium gallinarum TaxID=1324352 RepID=UPI0020254BEA|nr:hypothetical protein [Chryseobacterium gallinarum]MCL8535483.1 hypothetical protein [Chryseobacterium gallinarum]